MKKFMFLSLIVLSVSISQAANQETKPIPVLGRAKLPYSRYVKKMLAKHPGSPVVSPGALITALGKKTPVFQTTPAEQWFLSAQASPLGTPDFPPRTQPNTPSPVKNQYSSNYSESTPRSADQEFQDRSQRQLDCSGTILGFLKNIR